MSGQDHQDALQALRDFQAEAAALRTALRSYERTLAGVCRQLEQGRLLHEVMAETGVSVLRADLVRRLDDFESVRHRMRIACFRVALDEGLSAADIARLWGISRQLVSRMLHEDDGHAPAPASAPTHTGAITRIPTA